MHIIFISHQWTSFGHPDHSGRQHTSMVQACQKLMGNYNIEWAWVDYFSIPQQNFDLQQAAIDTLTVYAAHCSVFVAVTPTCTHGDLACRLDLRTYQRRAWCRLEQIAYLSASASAKELHAYYTCGEELRPLFDEDENEVKQPFRIPLEVMHGQFTCCARGHPNQCVCDKFRIVNVMLGTLWRLKSATLQEHSCVDEVLELLGQDTDRYSP